MKVFVAGGSGTIGVPLVRALVSAGHDVTAMTRTPRKQDGLRALGATPVLADALDSGQLKRVVAAAAPEVVIHQLTALPKAGIKSAADLEPTNRLRIDGTANLVAASVAAGARRIVGASFALLMAARPGADGRLDDGPAAMQSLESQIVDANRRGAIEGIVVRYGMWYGPDNPGTRQMVDLIRRRRLPIVRCDRSLLPVVHLDDAVGAAVAAVTRGRPGAVYDIVDDEPVSMTEIVRGIAERIGAPRPLAVPAWLPRLIFPYMARMTSIRLPLSNAKAREELGWRPAYPTLRDGLAATLSKAA